jgi:O-antigen ligase
VSARSYSFDRGSARRREPGEVGPLLGFAGVAIVAGVAAAFVGPVALVAPVVVLVTLWLARHPMPLLIAYLSIGVFKGTPLLEGLPLDPTLALGTLLAGVCVTRVISGRAFTVPMPLMATFVLLGALLVLSLAWTPIPGYGAEKALKFWTLTLLAVAAPFCLVEDERDLRSLLGWLLAVAVLGAVVTLIFGKVSAAADINNANTGRLEFGGVENTIFTSRLLCAGVVVAFFSPALGFGGRFGRVALPLIGVALLAVAASIGSRGPLVSLVLALAITVAVVVVRNPRALVPLLAMVMVGVAVLPFIYLPETSAARLRGITEDPVGTLQGDGRSRLYRQAIEIARAHPVAGLGSGGFKLYSAVLIRKELIYPHNIFLEVAAEIGIAAALALAACIIAVLVGLFRLAWAIEDPRGRTQVNVVTALLLLALFAAQFSGDINDNRVFWTTLALGWLVARHWVPAPARDERA